jgi:hypothetical protein
MVGRDGVLPVTLAGRLCLRASVDADQTSRHSRCRPCPAPGRGDDHAAALHREWLGRSADLCVRALAVGPVCGLDRAAVLRACGQQSVAAGLVRAHRPPCRTRSLFPLRLLQYRQLPCAVVLPGSAGADVHAACAGSDVDRRLWPADRSDRRLRRAPVELAAACRGRHGNRGDRFSGAELGVARALDLPRRGALGARGS